MSIAKETMLHAYRRMKTIREFEERVNAEIMNGQIPAFVKRCFQGFLHQCMYGAEMYKSFNTCFASSGVGPVRA